MVSVDLHTTKPPASVPTVVNATTPRHGLAGTQSKFDRHTKQSFSLGRKEFKRTHVIIIKKHRLLPRNLLRGHLPRPQGLHYGRHLGVDHDNRMCASKWVDCCTMPGHVDTRKPTTSSSTVV